MSRIECSYEVSKSEYIKKDAFDNVVHQLLVKISSLENKVNRLESENGSTNSLYRKMDELLTQMRGAYHFANDVDYEYDSE